MNLTFIIGNGLDIQLGMKTSYSDFFNHIFETKYNVLLDDESCRSKENIRSVIQNKVYREIYLQRKVNNQNWVDFELFIGEYTRMLLKNELNGKTEQEKNSIKEMFFNDLEEIERDLINYLKEQELSFQEKNSSIPKNILQNTLTYFYKGLLRNDIEIIDLYLKNLTKDYSNKCYFITFNYTSSLGTILEASPKSIKCPWNASFDIHVPGVVYAHGRTDHMMTLGLDNESQLEANLFTNEEIEDLIKPMNLDSTRDRMKSQAEKLIESSDIIVIFGTSLGETDAHWWKKISVWLAEKETRKLIIHFFKNGGVKYSTALNRDVKRDRKMIQNMFLRFSDNDIEKIRPQIFTIINNKNIFNIE